MYLINIRGRRTHKKISQYRIDWDGPSKSKIQYKCKQILKPYWCGHAVYEEFPVYGTRQKVDFINFTLHLAIEVNGLQHDKYVPHFHGNKQGFIKSLRSDREKAEWLEMNEIKLLELYEEDIKKLSPEYIKETFGIDIIV